MDKNEYWQEVKVKFDKLVADFRKRYRESIDTEFLPETRLAEIQKLWDISDYIIGYNGNEPFYDGGPLRFAYSDLAAGKRDYDNPEHLELDAYLQFEKWLDGEPTFWQSVTTNTKSQKTQSYNSDYEFKIIENFITIQNALKNQKLDIFFTTLKAKFASVPYYLSKQNERDFHRDIHLILSAYGFEIESEVATNMGRIDAVIEIEKLIYIMEFKITDVEKAMNQIEKRKYYQKYMNKGKEVILVGVAFSTAEKNITEWKSISLQR